MAKLRVVILTLAITLASGIPHYARADYNYPNLPSLSPDAVIKPWSKKLETRDVILSGDTIVSDTDAELEICQGCSLYSSSFNIRMTFQDDCNLVVYEGVNTASETVVWASNTDGNSNCVLLFQTDGNLVIYSSNVAIWSINYGGYSGQKALVMQNDRNLVVYEASGDTYVSGTAIWASSWGSYHGGSSQWASFTPNSVAFELYNKNPTTIYVPYSNDWRWNVYGDNVDTINGLVTNVGMYWSSSPVFGYWFNISPNTKIGNDYIYNIFVSNPSSVISDDYDGAGVYINDAGQLSVYGGSISNEFIIACDSYSGGNGQNCVIAVKGVGCANGIDSANPITFQIGTCA
ncbi:hypothetical protein HDU82_003329, partial [Entophlyctis luteolus]